MGKKLRIVTDLIEYSKGQEYYAKNFSTATPVSMTAICGPQGNAISGIMVTPTIKWSWANGKTYSTTGSVSYIRGIGDSYIEKIPNKVNSVFSENFYEDTITAVLPTQNDVPSNVITISGVTKEEIVSKANNNGIVNNKTGVVTKQQATTNPPAKSNTIYDDDPFYIKIWKWYKTNWYLALPMSLMIIWLLFKFFKKKRRR